jgi:hypothetical protein
MTTEAIANYFAEHRLMTAFVKWIHENKGLKISRETLRKVFLNPDAKYSKRVQLIVHYAEEYCDRHLYDIQNKTNYLAA